ncbi:hypothetical protein [Aeromicrobium sp. HA]|uniref:hypothetical protein n=1 Tax=Aeromicrobium sp. HA TaxID=3009077 RepID=UPI0022AEDDB2|nr:hypothetical protein [Aeromicrobium sp. HA]
MTGADSEGCNSLVDSEAATRARQAAALKERIYVVFTVLAVVIALRAHGQHPTAGVAIGTLALAVMATICAVYVADLLSHMVIHAHLPSASEHRHMLVGTLGAGAVAIPSLVCLALAGVGLYDIATGLLAAMLVTMATLVAVGLLAVRRLSMSRAQRIVILFAESALVLVVIALELLSHL